MCPDRGRGSPPPPAGSGLGSAGTWMIAGCGSSAVARCCGSFRPKSSNCASRLGNARWRDYCSCFFGPVDDNRKLVEMANFPTSSTTQDLYLV